MFQIRITILKMLNAENEYNFNRGGHNLNYDDGFKIESLQFEKHQEVIKEVLNAEILQLTPRGILDMVTGTDAVALIDGLVWGVSLRYRTKDYNSFTLNRHITEKASEINKWLQPNNTEAFKPIWHIQIADMGDDTYKLINVNIEAFKNRIQIMINEDNLEHFYRPELKAYEFSLVLKEFFGGIHTTVYTM